MTEKKLSPAERRARALERLNALPAFPSSLLAAVSLDPMSRPRETILWSDGRASLVARAAKKRRGARHGFELWLTHRGLTTMFHGFVGDHEFPWWSGGVARLAAMHPGDGALEALLTREGDYGFRMLLGEQVRIVRGLVGA